MQHIKAVQKKMLNLVANNKWSRTKDRHGGVCHAFGIGGSVSDGESHGFFGS
jgi:hypothetical protein